MIHITSTVKTLRDMMKPVEVIADECRLNISPEGLSVKTLDPANVVMIDLNLPKDVFHEGEWIVDETLQVGLDVVTYIDLFEGAEDNESVELSIEPFEKHGKQRHRLILKLAGIFEQTLYGQDVNTWEFKCFFCGRVQSAKSIREEQSKGVLSKR